ncbi:hypothetical protein PoB_000905500 [Plakobranchus ocellatus]|uniref:Uncharacterized protein n=1 Tax=Plakobranchus ocellatus TaxID=259542 RepID=A0AAV3YHI4_9GAST|nr:hypothetical protein PoB_000905500 [Plakobranchus ocellatus]
MIPTPETSRNDINGKRYQVERMVNTLRQIKDLALQMRRHSHRQQYRFGLVWSTASPQQVIGAFVDTVDSKSALLRFLHIASPQQGDLRLSGPPSGQDAGGGARTRHRRVPLDLRADSLATVLPTPLRPPEICRDPSIKVSSSTTGALA